jgi:hypothetical protein
LREFDQRVPHAIGEAHHGYAGRELISTRACAISGPPTPEAASSKRALANSKRPEALVSASAAWGIAVTHGPYTRAS